MDLTPVVPVAIGGLIAALAGYFTQRQAANSAGDREKASNDRHDAGVRRQLRALYRDLQHIILVARKNGLFDLRKWEPVHRRVMDRIYQPDVPIALTDDQLEQAYAISFACNIALAVARDLDQEFEKSQRREPFELQGKIKQVVKVTWNSFEWFWRRFNDDVRLQEWIEWNHEISD